jgi:hypothetical protein
MARRRYQKPKPRTEGRQWVIYYWDDEFNNGERRRKKKRHVLGPATMGERTQKRFAMSFCDRSIKDWLTSAPQRSLKIMWNRCTSQ